MKIIKIDKCLNCSHITWSTNPVRLFQAICDHDFYKTISGEIRLKMHDEHYWKIEDVNVIQEWCALEDAT